MAERLINIDFDKLKKHKVLSDAMEFVEYSRKEVPHLEILDKRKQEIEKSYPDKNEAELRLAIDEFIIRLLAADDFGIFDISDSMDHDTPGLEIRNRGIIMNEVFNMIDSGVVVWQPDRRFGLSPELQEQFK